MTAENLVKLLQMTGAAFAIPAAAAQQPGPRGLMRHWASQAPWSHTVPAAPSPRAAKRAERIAVTRALSLVKAWAHPRTSSCGATAPLERLRARSEKVRARQDRSL